MRTYILKRLLLMIPTLVAITLITYVIMRLAPGDPTRSSLFVGADAGTLSAEKRETEVARLLREKYYLDVNPVGGYFLWLRDVVWYGDFGTSITYARGRPVVGLFLERMPVTITLNVISLLVMYLVAVPLGVWSAVKRNQIRERAATVIVFMLWSLPVIWVGPMLQTLFARALGWLPVVGIEPESTYALGRSTWTVMAKTASYYVMPVLCLTYASFAGLSRYMRTGMLEVLRLDYVRTARAKGLAGRVVLFKHAMRNALIPIVTMMAGLLPGMIAGSVIVEYIFSIPGMGQLALSALYSRDYPMLMFSISLGTVLMLVGILISDLMYALVDPRITYD